MYLFLPEDVIIRQGEDGQQLYFINRGQVDVHILNIKVDRAFQRRIATEKDNLSKNDCSGHAHSVAFAEDDDNELLDQDTGLIKSK